MNEAINDSSILVAKALDLLKHCQAEACFDCLEESINLLEQAQEKLTSKM